MSSFRHEPVERLDVGYPAAATTGQDPGRSAWDAVRGDLGRGAHPRRPAARLQSRNEWRETAPRRASARGGREDTHASIPEHFGRSTQGRLVKEKVTGVLPKRVRLAHGVHEHARRRSCVRGAVPARSTDDGEMLFPVRLHLGAGKSVALREKRLHFAA